MQFFIVDIVVLIIQLALVPLPVFKYRGGPDEAVPLALLIISWWLVSLNILSRNAISRTASRFTVLIFSVPMGFCIAPLLLCFAMCALPTVIEALVRPTNYAVLIVLTGFWFALLLISIWACRDSIRHTIKTEAEPEPPQRLLQFHLSTLLAIVIALAGVVAANAPQETRYQKITNEDGSIAYATSSTNCSYGRTEYGWPAVFYTSFRSYDEESKSWSSPFHVFDLLVDLFVAYLACDVVVAVAGFLLNRKPKPAFSASGLEAIRQEAKKP
jgi:hypothetical protein